MTTTKKCMTNITYKLTCCESFGGIFNIAASIMSKLPAIKRIAKQYTTYNRELRGIVFQFLLLLQLTIYIVLLRRKR